MVQAHVKRQFDAAIENVESALRDLSDRLDSLSGGERPRNSIRRAGRTLRRTAGSFAEHVPLERASAIAAGTGRTVREHPVKTALTAAVAGYCIWSLIQYSTSRAAAGRGSPLGTGERSGKGQGQDEPQPRVEVAGEAEGFSRH